MLNTVVSVGCTRLFNGMGLGGGRLARPAIVVVVVDERSMRLASGSVPVLTDQRSTPQLAAAACDAEDVDKVKNSNAMLVESERTTHTRAFFLPLESREGVNELLPAKAHRCAIGNADEGPKSQQPTLFCSECHPYVRI